jgi:hypothetical protein
MVPALVASCALAIVAVAACSSFGDATQDVDASIAMPLPDGGGIDATPPADASPDRACPELSTFCDDFELGDLRRWGNLNVIAPCSMGIDDGGPPHRGGNALHFAAKETRDAGVPLMGYASIETKPFPAAVSAGTIAVRFYVKGSTIPSDGTTYVWLTKAGTDQAESILFSSFGNWAAESLAGSLGAGKVAYGNIPFATDKWLCAEWVVDVATAGRQQLFIDGNAEPVLAQDMDTIGDAGQGYQHAAIYMNNQGATTQELFFDDVTIAVFATRANGPRIGCIP